MGLKYLGLDLIKLQIQYFDIILSNSGLALKIVNGAKSTRKIVDKEV